MNIELSKKKLLDALEDLRKSIEFYDLAQNIDDEKISKIMYKVDFVISQRKSMIQSFEFCAELFWKYLKKYLENVLGCLIINSSPKNIIKESCQAKVISEVDSEVLLQMIKDRNFTSHIYKEEIAENVAYEIPKYYELMHKYISGLSLDIKKMMRDIDGVKYGREKLLE